jgi:NitT/TauT family transport system substrate-binding protein
MTQYAAHGRIDGANREMGLQRRRFMQMAAGGLALALRPGARAASLDGLTPTIIEVPGATNLQFLSLWVALGAGFFRKEGIAPQIVVARGPRRTGERLFAGEADIALLPPPMFLGMMAEGKPILLFANLLANEPINLVVRRDFAEARGMFRASDLGGRLQAIKGARIGLAGEVAPRLKVMAKSASSDAEDLFQLLVVPGPDQVDAFASGRVDALFAHTPYLETAMVEHNAVLVAETSRGEIAELADGQIHALATTRNIMREKPGLIAGVTAAIAGAQHLIRTDLKQTVDAIIASGAGGTTERRRIEALAQVYAQAVPPTPRISVEGIKRDVSLYPAHPRAPDFSRVQVADFVVTPE